MHSVGWISAGATSNTWLTVTIGAAWLAVITVITIYGIRWTANTQWFFLLIQYAALLGISIWGIIKVGADHPPGSRVPLVVARPALDPRLRRTRRRRVLGLFFFWGWDTAVNLNEESKNSTKIPGQAGILSMFLLLFIFVLNIVSAQMLLPAQEFSRQGANVLFYFAKRVGGPWIGYLMIIAVLSSTVADTQTTLLPAARITLDGPRRCVSARLRDHPRRVPDADDRHPDPRLRRTARDPAQSKLRDGQLGVREPHRQHRRPGRLLLRRGRDRLRLVLPEGHVQQGRFFFTGSCSRSSPASASGSVTRWSGNRA